MIMRLVHTHICWYNSHAKEKYPAGQAVQRVPPDTSEGVPTVKLAESFVVEGVRGYMSVEGLAKPGSELA